MKYTRLTKEQLDSLQQEFVTFLATQTITGTEWQQIKEKQPEVAEQEIDIFSDLVWERVLNQAKYLENISAHQLFLFEIGASEISLIMVKVTNGDIDFTTSEGYKWLQENFASEEVEFFTSTKGFSANASSETSEKAMDKNDDIFELVQQGAVITKGELYGFFSNIINM